MADAISWVSNNWMMIVGTAATISAGASILVKGIAPLTSNTMDDRAASWLDKAHSWLSKIALNPPTK